MPTAIALLAYSIHLIRLARAGLKTLNLEPSQKWLFERMEWIGQCGAEDSCAPANFIASVNKNENAIQFTDGGSYHGHDFDISVKLLRDLLGEPARTAKDFSDGKVQFEWVCIMECGNIFTLYDNYWIDGDKTANPNKVLSFHIGAHEQEHAQKAHNLLQEAIVAGSFGQASLALLCEMHPDEYLFNKGYGTNLIDFARARSLDAKKSLQNHEWENSEKIDGLGFVFSDSVDSTPADSKAGIVGDAVRKKQEARKMNGAGDGDEEKAKELEDYEQTRMPKSAHECIPEAVGEFLNEVRGKPLPACLESLGFKSLGELGNTCLAFHDLIQVGEVDGIGHHWPAIKKQVDGLLNLPESFDVTKMLEFYRSLPTELDLDGSLGSDDTWREENAMAIFEAHMDTSGSDIAQQNFGIQEVRSVLAEAVVPFEVLLVEMERYCDMRDLYRDDEFFAVFDWEMVPYFYETFYDPEKNEWSDPDFVPTRNGYSFHLISGEQIDLHNGPIPTADGEALNLPWRIIFGKAEDLVQRLEEGGIAKEAVA